MGRRVKWKEVWCVDERRWKKREGKQGGKERGGGRERFLAYEKSEANSRCLFQSLLRRSSINLQLSNYQLPKAKTIIRLRCMYFSFPPPPPLRSFRSPSPVLCRPMRAVSATQFAQLESLQYWEEWTNKDLADHNVLGLKSICCVCH